MLTRRGLFAGIGTALCGGAATGSVPAEPAKLRQVSQDVKLYRLPRAAEPDMVPIDWFDQRAGDRVMAIWTSGRIEGWSVTGEPYMHPRNGEAVPIEEERYYCTVEPTAAFLYDPYTDTVSVGRNKRVETYKGKPTPATPARRPRPRPLIGRPVIVAK